MHQIEASAHLCIFTVYSTYSIEHMDCGCGRRSERGVVRRRSSVTNGFSMCLRLKKNIISTWKEECEGRGDEKEQRCPQLNMVWLHCDGENDPDRENIGPVSGGLVIAGSG